MNHPIANNRRNLIIYGIFWMLSAVIHGTIFYTFFDASIYLSIADGFMSSLLFGLIGLGLWYAVRYSQMEVHNIGNLILNHLTAVAITLVMLLLLNYYSIQTIPVVKEGYVEFFNKTLIWRIFTGVIQYILVVLVYFLILYYANYVEKINKESEMKISVKVSEINE